MIAHKFEDNPVYQDQVRKRRNALCAAFAIAAGSTGVLVVAAKDGPDKFVAAGAVTVFAAWVTLSKEWRRNRMQDEQSANASHKAYGPDHPYQVVVDQALRDYPDRKGVMVYAIGHTFLSGVAETNYKNIYLDTEFERVMNNTEHMKALVAHEAGHVQESKHVRLFDSFNMNLAGASAYSLPIMLAFTMPLPAVGVIAAGSLGIIAATYLTLQKAGRYTEHICDIRGMYNVGSKTVMQETFLNLIPSCNQIAENDFKEENLKRVENKEPPFDLPKPKRIDYRSRFSTHPNPLERKAVMDEAAKYMP